MIEYGVSLRRVCIYFKTAYVSTTKPSDQAPADHKLCMLSSVKFRDNDIGP